MERFSIKNMLLYIGSCGSAIAYANIEHWSKFIFMFGVFIPLAIKFPFFVKDKENGTK